MTYDDKVEAYMKAIQVACNRNGYVGEPYGFVARETARKFDKIIIELRNGQSTVHCFVERSTGNVIKAAGWKAPQRSRDGVLAVRYNLDNLDEWADKIDPFGGYLYER